MLTSQFLQVRNPSMKKKLPLKKVKHIIDKYYNKCKQTKTIVNDFGFITLTKCFKYLSLCISNDLDDRYILSLVFKRPIKP